MIVIIHLFGLSCLLTLDLFQSHSISRLPDGYYLALHESIHLLHAHTFSLSPSEMDIISTVSISNI